MHSYMQLNEQQVYDGVVKYGPACGSKKIMDWEYQHALEAIDTQQYITYWCEKKKSECGRIGSESKCFCGHLFKDHNRNAFKNKIQTNCNTCSCKYFKFVPTRPEECGLYWLPRRKDFNVHKWRAKCKCNHDHEHHNPVSLKCQSCGCFRFESDFECISCDCLWEEHTVLYETEMERKQLKKPIGDAFLPLSTHQHIQDVVLGDKIERDKEIIFARNMQKIQQNMQKIRLDRQEQKDKPNYNRPRPQNKKIANTNTNKQITNTNKQITNTNKQINKK